MTFIKRNPIWDKSKRADIYSKALYAVAEQAIADIHENIDASVPAGRTYRRGRIVRVATKKNAVQGLRSVVMSNGKKGRVVGNKFHKASASGQPPARDTSRLYRGMKMKRLAAYRIRVFNDVEYARYLEPPAKLNRPFFYSVIEKNRSKYEGIVRTHMRPFFNR